MRSAPALIYGVVRRPALLERLEAGAAGSVTVLAAPAGSGKTVLVRSWLDHLGSAHRAGWVTVERGERDAQHFWSAVVAALAAAAPQRQTIQALAPTPEFDGTALVGRLVAELAALDVRLILVIDDLHELSTADGLSQLSLLLDNLPPELHVVLLTRRDLSLGLHRRRLAGGLTEIRSADLRFTLAETREMLAAARIVLSDDGVELLHDRTEGWAAALRLAALALASTPDPEGFVVQFSGSERTVAEYLLAEVLDNQPPDVRRLLVRSSLLDRVNGPLGDLLTGGSGAERHLQALADAGGLVVAVDAHRTWFRFHRLFADLLAAELRHTEPGEIPRLHAAAAQWYAAHDQTVEAIVHAQAAGERQQAIGLFIKHYFSLVLDGRQATAHALLETFGTDPDFGGPESAVVRANDYLVAGSLDQAAAYIALAEGHADEVPEERRHRFDMALLVTQLSLARRRGDLRSVADAVHGAGAMVEADDGYEISMHDDVRALMLMNLGIVEVWSGLRDDGMRHLEQTRELAHQMGRPYLEVSSAAHWAQARSWLSFTGARAACLEAVALAERYGWGDDPVIAQALVTLGTSLLHAGRLDEAELCLGRAEKTLRGRPDPSVGFLLHMANGGAHLARGRYQEALASFRDADRLGLLLVNPSPLDLQLSCATLYALLGSGEIERVKDGLAGIDEAERGAGEVREVLAGLALVEGDARRAVDVLAPTLRGTAEVHHPVVLVRSLLLESRARQALGQTRDAEDAVERALDLAEKDAMILPFISVPCRDLLEHHPHHRTAHGAFLAEILDVLSGGAPRPEHATPTLPVEPLSDAELRVLGFLPTNLPAGDIAEQIYVSVHTVKTHLRHIYAKLEAHSRVEAVERARELGLLGRSGR